MMQPVGVKCQRAAGRGHASRCWADFNLVGWPLFRSGIDQNQQVNPSKRRSQPAHFAVGRFRFWDLKRSYLLVFQ